MRGTSFGSMVLILAACGSSGSTGGGGAADASTVPGTPDAAPGPGTPDAATAPGSPDAAVPGTPDAATPTAPDAGPTATCGDATFLPLPTDTAAPGPWPVGARTVAVGPLAVEVWYPATPGSDAGAEPLQYDIRLQLPPSQQDKIPDEDNPWQVCDCARDLPLDTGHGPYPVIVFIHGTAGFRTQSLTQMTHWASRGFIVLAADHPGLKLADALSFLCPDSASGPQDLAGNVDDMLAALAGGAGDLAFVDGHADLDRIAVIGHSAGGNTVANLTNRDGVRVCIPMAANTRPAPAPTLESSLLLGALSDTVVAYTGTQSAFNSAPRPKRLVGISNTGHLAFSDLCELQNDSGDNIVEIATDYGVCGVGLAGFLFDCNPSYLDAAIVRDIVNATTSAVLEDVLMCSDAEAVFDTLESAYPDVAELQQQL